MRVGERPRHDVPGAHPGRRVTRRIAFACAVFALGVVVGLAVLHPAGNGKTALERAAARAVAAASGGHIVDTTCSADHCGVVVRQRSGPTCQGWVVPLAGGTLGTPRRAAFVDC